MAEENAVDQAALLGLLRGCRKELELLRPASTPVEILCRKLDRALAGQPAPAAGAAPSRPSDFLGAIPDLTGDLSSEEHLRRLRGGDPRPPPAVAEPFFQCNNCALEIDQRTAEAFSYCVRCERQREERDAAVAELVQEINRLLAGSDPREFIKLRAAVRAVEEAN